MSDTDVLDLDTLLAPIDSGAGLDPRAGRNFPSMQLHLDEARELEKLRDMPFREDDAQDAQSSATAAARLPAVWQKVCELSQLILLREGKDFEVAVCMLEGLVRLAGLAGLTAGTKLLHGVLDRYWDSGFPLPNEDGLDLRSRWIGRLSGAGDEDDPRTGMGGALLPPLRRMPLFTGANGEPRALWQFTRRRDATLDLDAATEAARGDLGTLQANGAAAREAAAAWAAFEEAVSARFPGDYAPSTRRVGQVLTRIATLATRVAGDIPPTPAAVGRNTGEASLTPAGAAPAGSAGPAMTAAAIITRDDALRQLEQLAAFFRRTEPQSPLSYTLADAVRRAHLPLPELLAEVMGEDSGRNALLTALGIRPPQSGE